MDRHILGDISAPSPHLVRSQLERLHRWTGLRGKKLLRLLDFLVEEWFADQTDKLTTGYIGQAVGEPLTFEEHSDRWGYPRTRANLAHLRSRLKKFYETDGFRDPVIIQLIPGTFAPLIVENPVIVAIRTLDPSIKAFLMQTDVGSEASLRRGRWRDLLMGERDTKSEEPTGRVAAQNEIRDLTAAEHLRMAISFALVYEAQNRISEAVASLESLIGR